MMGGISILGNGGSTENLTDVVKERGDKVL